MGTRQVRKGLQPLKPLKTSPDPHLKDTTPTAIPPAGGILSQDADPVNAFREGALQASLIDNKGCE